MGMNSKVAFFAWPLEWEAGTGVAGGRGVGQSSSGMGYVSLKMKSTQGQ